MDFLTVILPRRCRWEDLKPDWLPCTSNQGSGGFWTDWMDYLNTMVFVWTCSSSEVGCCHSAAHIISSYTTRRRTWLEPIRSAVLGQRQTENAAGRRDVSRLLPGATTRQKSAGATFRISNQLKEAGVNPQMHKFITHTRHNKRALNPYVKCT